MKGLGLRFAGISEGRLRTDPIQTGAPGHKSFPTGVCRELALYFHHDGHPKKSPRILTLVTIGGRASLFGHLLAKQLKILAVW